MELLRHPDSQTLVNIFNEVYHKMMVLDHRTYWPTPINVMASNDSVIPHGLLMQVLLRDIPDPPPFPTKEIFEFPGVNLMAIRSDPHRWILRGSRQ